MIAASLWFDPALEAALRSAWEELARRGISRSLLERPYRPHLTLGVWERMDVPAFAEALRGQAASTPSFLLTLAGVGAFEGAESVAWLRPAGLPALVALQARVHALGCAHGSGALAYQLPAAWHPHVTMAWGLDGEALARALEFLGTLPLPLRGRAAAIGVIDTPAEVELERLPLPPGGRLAASGGSRTRRRDQR